MHMRFTRSTASILSASSFYRDVLGLVILAEFHDHDGFSGAILSSSRDCAWQLEFVTHRDRNANIAANDLEQAFVLYCNDEEFEHIKRRLEAIRARALENRNPYWKQRGALTICGPDNETIIIVRGSWNTSLEPANET